MIKALLLIFEPVATWEGILRTRRSVAWILGVYLVPLLLITSAIEGYGLVHSGKWQSGDLSRLRKFSAGEAVVLESGQFLLSLLVVFGCAKLLKSIGETFNGRHTYSQAFTAVAYSLGPLFLFRLLDVFPGIDPWVGWSIGIILSVMAFYNGVPRCMEPDPSHAFGLFVMSALLLLLVSALVHFLTSACIQGRYPVLQSLVSGLAARLPFR
jgi:hypothetical protein